jgi:hypothetical protein
VLHFDSSWWTHGKESRLLSCHSHILHWRLPDSGHTNENLVCESRRDSARSQFCLKTTQLFLLGDHKCSSGKWRSASYVHQLGWLSFQSLGLEERASGDLHDPRWIVSCGLAASLSRHVFPSRSDWPVFDVKVFGSGTWKHGDLGRLNSHEVSTNSTPKRYGKFTDKPHRLLREIGLQRYRVAASYKFFVLFGTFRRFQARNKGNYSRSL